MDIFEREREMDMFESLTDNELLDEYLENEFDIEVKRNVSSRFLREIRRRRDLK
jgi:hypothetical protein